MADKKSKRSRNTVKGDNIGGVVGDNGKVEAGKIVGGDELNVSPSQKPNDPFAEVYAAIAKRPADDTVDKEEILEAVELIRAEIETQDQVDETRVMRRLRNLGRMAPDILDVVLATISNPVNGFTEVLRDRKSVV